MPKVRARYEFSGLPDYWGGNGRRWDDNAGCVFAYYDGRTTLRDLIDSAVDDFCMGGDFEPRCSDCDPWADITEDDVRAALLDCLTDSGRADYESGAIAECAADYAAINGFDEDCEPDYEYCDSPVCIFLLEIVEDDE